jgi:hypothetical protein
MAPVIRVRERSRPNPPIPAPEAALEPVPGSAEALRAEARITRLYGLLFGHDRGGETKKFCMVRERDLLAAAVSMDKLGAKPARTRVREHAE